LRQTSEHCLRTNRLFAIAENKPFGQAFASCPRFPEQKLIFAASQKSLFATVLRKQGTRLFGLPFQKFDDETR
jgi:hypothetical protein